MSKEALGDGPHEVPAIIAAKAKAKAKTPELPSAIPAGMMCCFATAKPVPLTLSTPQANSTLITYVQSSWLR
jgi:hypothetical protein